MDKSPMCGTAHLRPRRNVSKFGLALEIETRFNDARDFRTSIPAEDTLAPRVDVRDHACSNEEQNARQEQQRLRTLWFKLREGDGPWVQENNFHVEHQEGHGQHIEANIEPLARSANSVHAAFHGRALCGANIFWPQQRTSNLIEGRKPRRHYKDN